MGAVSVAEPTPTLAFIAASGTGKTTLLTALLPALKARGVRCAVIKHSHHDFAVDIPVKDSYRLREAGAQQVLLASPHRWFLVEEGDGVTEPALSDLLGRLDHSAVDLVLVEGYSQASVAKIEVHRPARRLPLRCADDPDVIAVATDDPGATPSTLPLLPLNDVDAVTAFVCEWLHGQPSSRGPD